MRIGPFPDMDATLQGQAKFTNHVHNYLFCIFYGNLSILIGVVSHGNPTPIHKAGRLTEWLHVYFYICHAGTCLDPSDPVKGNCNSAVCKDILYS